MSNKPNPVALTACMLAMRAAQSAGLPPIGSEWGGTHGIHTVAALASDLHRLAPACKRQAEAECNGEFRDGQRQQAFEVSKRSMYPAANERAILADLEQAIQSAGARLDRRLARLNERLAPLALQATREGDPRGWCLRISSTDTARPVPRNGMSDEWGIA